MLRYQGKKLVREVPPGDPEWPGAILWPSSADLFLNTETLKGYLLFLHVYGIRFVVNTYSGRLQTSGFGLMKRLCGHLPRDI